MEEDYSHFSEDRDSDDYHDFYAEDFWSNRDHLEESQENSNIQTEYNEHVQPNKLHTPDQPNLNIEDSNQTMWNMIDQQQYPLNLDTVEQNSIAPVSDVNYTPAPHVQHAYDGQQVPPQQSQGQYVDIHHQQQQYTIPAVGGFENQYFPPSQFYPQYQVQQPQQHPLQPPVMYLPQSPSEISGDDTDTTEVVEEQPNPCYVTADERYPQKYYKRAFDGLNPRDLGVQNAYLFRIEHGIQELDIHNSSANVEGITLLEDQHVYNDFCGAPKHDKHKETETSPFVIDKDKQPMLTQHHFYIYLKSWCAGNCSSGRGGGKVNTHNKKFVFRVNINGSTYELETNLFKLMASRRRTNAKKKQEKKDFHKRGSELLQLWSKCGMCFILSMEGRVNTFTFVAQVC